MAPHLVAVQFDILAVKADQTVTIRTRDFPIRTRFTVRMDVVGKQGAGGTLVAEFNSAQGGVIEATYPIPAALHGQIILALRIESPDGYLAYRWFFNEDTPLATLPASAQAGLTLSQAWKGVSVDVEARNLPPNADFWVRVGPYATFFKNYAVSDHVTSGADGVARFTLALPKSVQAADYLMVRMDYGPLNVSGIYQNVDGGQMQDAKKLVPFQWCRVVGVNGQPALSPGEGFQTRWRVQNTSNTTWKGGSFGYKFKTGERLQKYKDIYSVNWPMRDGWSFDVAVDMIAPQEPGWHTTTWVMFRDNENSEVDSDMCAMKISVLVKGK
ncbi:MAG TPA: NBR1-Ig-like domain-containing protein [Anaerolineaceae bacterium]